MKLKVTLSWVRGERSSARLSAKVNQGDRFGSDLLAAHRYTNIDSAIQAADRKLQAEYKLIDPPEIEWDLPAETEGK